MYGFVFWPGVLRNTAKLVEKVVKLKCRYPNIVDYVLNAMHEVCEKASQIIRDMGHAEANSLNTPDFKLLEVCIF